MKKKPDQSKTVTSRASAEEKPEPPVGAKAPGQSEIFSEAMRCFHARRFADARALFFKALNGESREIGHKAELLARACDQRLGQQAVELKTAEDHYNYAIALINLRKLTPAAQHLDAALRMQPGVDHVHYAMGLCKALSGDLHGAYEHLHRAIEINPNNRQAVLHDPDFAHFVHQAPLDVLLNPDRARPF